MEGTVRSFQYVESRREGDMPEAEKRISEVKESLISPQSICRSPRRRAVMLLSSRYHGTKSPLRTIPPESGGTSRAVTPVPSVRADEPRFALHRILRSTADIRASLNGWMPGSDEPQFVLIYHQFGLLMNFSMTVAWLPLIGLASYNGKQVLHKGSAIWVKADQHPSHTVPESPVRCARDMEGS